VTKAISTVPDRPGSIDDDRRPDPLPSAGPRRSLEGIDWKTYESMIGNPAVRRDRIAYDRGLVEMMSPSHEHKIVSEWIARLIGIVAVECDRPMRSAGSTTRRRADLQKGIEPDKCFYFKNEPIVRGKKTIDLSVDPPPDLAIEIEIADPLLDRIAIYSAIGVPEIWIRRDGAISFRRLQDDATYRLIDRSECLPLLTPGEVAAALASIAEVDEIAWAKSIRIRAAERRSAGYDRA
jgi:Uma2 family endonuclease